MSAGREAHRPRNRQQSVLAGDPCPAVKCPLAHKACVLDTVPGCLTCKDRLLNTAVRAERQGLVFTLWKLCTCLWAWSHVFSRPLVGGVTLHSGEPLGETPESGAGDAKLLIRNLWHHWGTLEEPLLLQGA